MKEEGFVIAINFTINENMIGRNVCEVKSMAWYTLVNDIIMPIVGFLTAGTDFSSLKYVMTPAVMDGETVITPEAAILYGSFIKNIVDFLIIAFSIFIAIKLINKANKKKVEAPAPAPEPAPVPEDVKLLEEIRDLLKAQK